MAIDGSVTLGDPLEDVPEQAATARTAAPVSPRIERRIDMTRPQQQGGADRTAPRAPFRQTHRQAGVTGGLQPKSRGVGAWFDLRMRTIAPRARPVVERAHGIPPPPTTSTFDATAWGDTSFSGSRHEAVLFADVDLSDVTERRAAFVDCTFRDVRFNAATHTDAAFTNCTFVRCTFFNTRFTRCKVVGSLFDRCTYKLLVVEGGDWSLVGMPGADLRGSDLSALDPLNVDLAGAQIDDEQATVIAEALGLKVG